MVNLNKEKKMNITILFPLYNEDIKIAKKALDSILRQSFSDFLIYVTLDNPDNNELELLVKKYQLKDSRIIFRKNKRNRGLAETLNLMLMNVTTKYVARMDADDIAFKRRLEIQYNFMEENPEIDLCGANTFYIDNVGKIIGKRDVLPQRHETIVKCLKYWNCIAHPCFFAKTTMMKDVMYRSSLKYAQDYDFLCRCVEKGYHLSNVKQYLLYYRVGNIKNDKMVIQDMTAYYIKKYYRKKELCKRDDLAELIWQDICRSDMETLIKYAVSRETILSAEKDLFNGDIISFLQKIYHVLFPHKMKRDNRLSFLIYNILMKNEKV